MVSNSKHTNRGKWSMPGVPHKGWSCVAIDDLEEPTQQCEMCESVDIRYVHYMAHSDYPDTLAVGCVCAEHMEHDYTKPKEREKNLRRLAQRRKSWGTRSWKKSQAGNPYLNTEGFNLIVYKKATGYGVQVSKRGTVKVKKGKKNYSTEGEAKTAALTALLWAKTNL